MPCCATINTHNMKQVLTETDQHDAFPNVMNMSFSSQISPNYRRKKSKIFDIWNSSAKYCIIIRKVLKIKCCFLL